MTKKETHKLSAENFGETTGLSIYEPHGRYDGILWSVYKNKGASLALKTASKLSVVLSIAAFCAVLGFYLYTGWIVASKLAIVCAVPFIVVSIFRRVLNTPRPYEILPFYGKAPKKKKGQSFPSRHVFSIFVIAASVSFVNLPLGIALAVLGVMLAVARVLLGIHFVKDVVAGALIGITSGVIGMLIANAII